MKLIAFKKTKEKFINMNIPLHVIKNELIIQTGINFDVKSRKRPLPYIRAIYFVLCKELNPISTYKIIGNSLIHNKTHANVMHGINNIFPEVLDYEPGLVKIYSTIKNKFFYNKFKYKTKDIEVRYVNLLNGVIR